MHIEGVFCDLVKAFDFLNQEILLAKLHFCGIWGVTEDWFRGYLNYRRHKVKSPNTA